MGEKSYYGIYIIVPSVVAQIKHNLSLLLFHCIAFVDFCFKVFKIPQMNNSNKDIISKILLVQYAVNSSRFSQTYSVKL